MTLTEFLLARIAEDEAAARACSGAWNVSGWSNEDVNHVAWFADPARVLAECEAKRRIVELHKARPHTPMWGPVLCALALPYADHPDYLEEWKP